MSEPLCTALHPAPSKRLAFVKTTFEAWHRWPEAPDEVRYLQHKHRHVFHVELYVDQEHSDRSVEYHMLLTRLTRKIRRRYDGRDLGPLSCEMIAEDLLAHFISKGYNVQRCLVSEDGENGAEVWYE